MDPNPNPTPDPNHNPNPNHYKDLVEKPFFPSLLEYMMSGPVTCMVCEG